MIYAEEHWIGEATVSKRDVKRTLKWWKKLHKEIEGKALTGGTPLRRFEKC